MEVAELCFIVFKQEKKTIKSIRVKKQKYNFIRFDMGFRMQEKRVAKLLKELYKVRNKTIEHRKQIVQ